MLQTPSSKLQAPSSKLWLALSSLLISSAFAASPTITPIDPPQNGFTLSANPMLTFSITSYTTILTLTAAIDGQIATATFNPGTSTWSLAPTNLTDGPHTYALTVIDANTNPASLQVNFATDLADPAVTIDSPTNGQSEVGPNVSFSGTFSGLNGYQMGSLILRIDNDPNQIYACDYNWTDEHSGAYEASPPIGRKLAPGSTPSSQVRAASRRKPESASTFSRRPILHSTISSMATATDRSPAVTPPTAVIGSPTHT